MLVVRSFFDFQVDLFVKTESFTLRTLNCGHSWARTEVGLDYITDDFLVMYYNPDSNDGSGNDSDSDDQSNCFSSSLCYTEMKLNLIFERFCLSCQNTLLIYFTRNVHIISNSFEF